MGIIKLLQKWCLSILNVLVQILRIPFRRFLQVPTRQTPSDPQAPTSTESQNPFDELAPFSAPKSTEPCQIFINHRGIDVKYTLASKIHHKLESMGYRAFLDVESLEPGDVITAEIEAAMKSASLHVAIFTPNYADSPWCLAELSFILKTGATVIPIFYHVQPSDLRYVKHGVGKYVDAFSEYEKKGRYTQGKVNDWKEALRNISFISGIEVKNNEQQQEQRETLRKEHEESEEIGGVNSYMMIVAFITMATADETLPTFTQLFQFEAKYNYLPAFTYFVIANAIGAGYLVLSLPISIFNIVKPRFAAIRMFMVFFDTVMVAVVTSGGAAGAAIVYLAQKGNTNWFAICQQFNSFCQQAGGALVASFSAVVFLDASGRLVLGLWLVCIV